MSALRPSGSVPTELIERLSASAVGGRELDREIYLATRPTSDFAEYQAMFRDDPEGHAFWMSQADYTTSVDAALALAERVLPGWHVTAGNHHSILHDRTGPNAVVSRAVDERNYDGDSAQWVFAATIPLALCIAILRALKADANRASPGPSGDAEGVNQIPQQREDQ